MDLQLIGTKINTAIHTIINALVPNQSGNAGKFLTTNGTNTSWSDISSSSPRAIDLVFGQTDIEIDLSSVDLIFFESRGTGTIVDGNEQQNIQFTNWIEGKQYTIIVSNKWTGWSRFIVNQFIGNRVGTGWIPYTQPSGYQMTIFTIWNGIFYVIYASDGNLNQD